MSNPLLPLLELAQENKCDLSSSLFNLDANTMVQKYRKDIFSEAKDHNIDARAIAAAITWEYEENKKFWLPNRYSDYVQILPYLRGLGQGVGWASIHDGPAKEIRPKESTRRLDCLRFQALPAIKMIADIMDQRSHRYFEITEGIWVRDNPIVLTAFFNAEELIKKSARKHPKSQRKPVEALDISGGDSEMAKWTLKHIGRFSEFQSNPNRPTGEYSTVIAH
jgi:hypothetical protein